MTESTYTEADLNDMFKVAKAIKANTANAEQLTIDFPAGLLEGLVYAAKDYAREALAQDLACSFFDLGIFASKHGLEISTFALAGDLYDLFEGDDE